MERRIGIVGAGVSGRLACKYALAKGYYPIVFESRRTIGGVWIKTMEITKLQTSKSIYQFSDSPWPSSVETDYPNSHQVFDYLQSYATHFDLLRHIRFNTRVLNIEYEGTSEEEMHSWALWTGNGDPFGNKGDWVLNVEDLISGSIEVIRLDFMILCLGQFSDVASIPEFPSGKGPDVFKGEVMHSMEYSAMDFKSARNIIKDKKITVIGYQKSAFDIAMECSTINRIEHPCTIICRTPRWTFGDDFPWEDLYTNRFSELMVHKPGEGFLLGLVATLLSPLRWVISKFVESNIKRRHPLKKYNMIPNHSFLQEINSCNVTVIPDGYYHKVDEGSVILKRSQNFSFCKDGIVFDQQDFVKSDLVVFATGYKGDHKLRNILASTQFQDYIMGSPDASVPLYRQCIHPRIPQLAVIGHSESLSNLYTSELRCRWLAELLDGQFKLPSIREMEKDVTMWDKFMKRYSGKYYRRSCIGALHIWYNDQLCKDMGLSPRRKKGLWAELFEPYGPMDYASTPN